MCSNLLSRQPRLRKAAADTLRHLAERDAHAVLAERVETSLFSALDSETGRHHSWLGWLAGWLAVLSQRCFERSSLSCCLLLVAGCMNVHPSPAATAPAVQTQA
jgi:hypothetical protein